eukprot:TRINITY_DN10240_c0_g1_i1.p1 TRINITY_DN10240_c0_g1~~TRINITY_DN10240_c0_g1_i1.p1  ORF type:complete len:460 (-),score=84.61 TRINITY_DN10240_c0_g1_i1:43-1422(-)
MSDTSNDMMDLEENIEHIIDDDQESTPVDVLEVLEKLIKLAQKTAKTKEDRHLQRSIRSSFSKKFRDNLSAEILLKLVLRYFPDDNSEKGQLVDALNANVDIIDLEAEPPIEIYQEVEIYISLLVLVFVIDQKRAEDAVELSSKLIARLDTWNNRTLDPLSSKAYFYYSLSYEIVDRLDDIRIKLLELLRTATLRHNHEGQVMLLNLLLRNYLHYSLYEQAYKLVRRVDFDKDHASSNQLSRYYYYYGRIKAVRLEYSEAYTYLQLALQKAPQSTAKGFQAIVNKYLCIVRLLLGEIPERGLFNNPTLKHVLQPYLELTKVVRSGDVSLFGEIVNRYSNIYTKDNTLNMILRLRHNVIKTCLKKINHSYSRISFEDICSKLNLDSSEDVEFIVAKAIQDNIIDAKINHDGGFVISNTSPNEYASSAPQKAFHERVSFCLQLHNDAVKAMRYHEVKTGQN